MRDKKKVAFLSVLSLLIVFGIFIFHSLNQKGIQNLLEGERETEEEILKIKNAQEEFSKNSERAEIIHRAKTNKKVLAINFQGLSDEETNEEVLKLLQESKEKVEFFVSGNTAAENTSFVKKISNKKHELGSNSLFGDRQLHENTGEELVEDFVRTNLIFRKIIKKEPKLLLLNGTKYTDDVLRAAYVSGNTHVVEPTHFLNYQSFIDYEQTENFIRNLKKGSILTIKMDGILEEDEYDTDEQPAKPAIDKQPGTKEYDEHPLAELTPEERLLKNVEWLLTAVEELDYEIVPLRDLDFYDKEIDETSDSTNKVDNKFRIGAYDERLKLYEPFSEKKEKNKRTKNYYFTKKTIKKSHKKTPAKEKEKKPAEKNEEEKWAERIAQKRKENNGQKAQIHHTIYTTEKALAYTFYGIENKKVLDGVLNNLDTLQAKGTFFVSKRDVENNLATIKKITQKGHEIGLALIENREKDFDSTLKSLLFMQDELKNITDKTPNLVRYPYYVDAQAEILEAISAADAQLIWDDLSVATSQVGPAGNVDQVMATIFGAGNLVAQRGYIVYYRMDYYQNSETIPKAMLKIAKNKIDTIAYPGVTDSVYHLKTVGHLLNSSQRYQYPVYEGNYLAELQNKVYPGQLDGLNKFEEVKARYIGNPSIDTIETLPGFEAAELDEIDKVGRIQTSDKVLFLTFDDWSSDKPINQLLAVLDKHGIKGNFFIRTNYMQNNPNILRAIAEAGHDIGNHSDQHLPLANDESTGGAVLYTSLDGQQVKDRQNDLLLAHNKILSVVGDVKIDGKPAFNMLFRPPTLAVSKVGIEGMLDMGYKHVVNGDFSTHDYEARDPYVLANKLIQGFTTEGGMNLDLQNGSILVMHMYDFVEVSEDTPNITAAALDIAIPELINQGYRFVRLSDYLY